MTISNYPNMTRQSRTESGTLFKSNQTWYLNSLHIFRYFYKATLFTVFISLCLWQTDAWLMDHADETSLSQEQFDKTKKRVVYVLAQDDWTEFPILSKHKLLKVVSNASVPRVQALSLEENWQYALNYQILDQNGNLLVERSYYHRTKAKALEDKATHGTGIFYFVADHQPADGRDMYVNLSDMPQATLLRLRLESADPLVKDVAIRVYWRELNEEYKLSYLWYRLSNQQRQLLARASIYDYDLLHEQEIRNLLRERWVPVGPLGVAGSEYQPRDFYIRKPQDNPIFYSEKSSFGVPIGKVAAIDSEKTSMFTF
jgi:hypothetical protein